MSKCKKVNISNKARMELHDALSLTGAEISINTLPAGECVPFVHCHKTMKRYMGSYLEVVKSSLMVTKFN